MRTKPLRFECQSGCTRCCDRQGFVYLTDRDSDRIANYLGLTTQQFETQYVFRTAHLRRLRTPRSSHCHFLTATGCSIHAVKPAQCGLFPFWPEYVEEPSAWRALGEWCPGIGKGEFIQITNALKESDKMREAYPGFYPKRSC
jgi:Fe-S-cluster containining protein